MKFEFLKKLQLLVAKPERVVENTPPDEEDFHSGAAKRSKATKRLTSRPLPSQSYVPNRKEDWEAVTAPPVKE